MKRSLFFLVVSAGFLCTVENVHAETNAELLSRTAAEVRVTSGGYPIVVPNDVKRVALELSLDKGSPGGGAGVAQKVKVSLEQTPLWKPVDTKTLDMRTAKGIEIGVDLIGTLAGIRGRVVSNRSMDGIPNALVTVSDGKGHASQFACDGMGKFDRTVWLPQAQGIAVSFAAPEHGEVTKTLAELQTNPIIIMAGTVAGASIPAAPGRPLTMFAATITDVFGQSVVGNAGSLSFFDKSGKLMIQSSMVEGSNMLAALVDTASLSPEFGHGMLQITAPKTGAKVGEQRFASLGQRFFRLPVGGSPAGKFAAGVLECATPEQWQAWLLRSEANRTPLQVGKPDAGSGSSVAAITAVESDGTFSFAFEKGMETGVYTLAFSQFRPGTGDVLCWLHILDYEPALSGASSDYSIGMDIRVKAPPAYIASYLCTGHVLFGGQQVACKTRFRYDARNRALIEAINAEIKRRSIPMQAIAPNAAIEASFEIVSPVKGSLTATAKQPRFSEGLLPAYEDPAGGTIVDPSQRKDTGQTTLLAGTPLGARSVLAPLKSIMKTLASTGEPSKKGGAPLLLFGQWSSGDKIERLAEAPISAPSFGANFSTDLKGNILEKVAGSGKAFRLSVLVFDHTYLRQCDAASFEMPAGSLDKLGDLTVFVLSASFTGDDSYLKQDMDLLRKALAGASKLTVVACNPLEKFEQLVESTLGNSIPSANQSEIIWYNPNP